MESKNYRAYIANVLRGVSYAGAQWGQKFFGSLGLVSDAIAEGGRQAFYARLPGHEQQAEDSLLQVTKDRGLWRFIGETKTALAERVQNAWDAYEQAGTDIQMLRAINEWGNARYPDTWIDGAVTLTESVVPTVFEFTVTNPEGLIDPISLPLYGDPGLTYGMADLYYGYDVEGNFVDLYRLVKQWKPARSRGFVRVEISTGVYSTLEVA